MSGVEDGPLAEWLAGLFFVMMALEDIELVGDGVRLDYSGASLRRVEGLVLDRYGVPEDVGDEEQRAFTHGLVAYVGETFMRRAGGAWGWTTGERSDVFPGGVPVVRADPALGLAALSPVELFREAVAVGDGERLSARYRSWEGAVEGLQQTRPGWVPRKEPTVLDRPEPPAVLPGWLARQEKAFPAWVAEYGAAGTWDFSPESLADLEDLVRRTAATGADFYAPEQRSFADGAVWYFGEVVRRGLGGEWNYNDGDTSDENFPYVDEIGPDGSMAVVGIILGSAPRWPPGDLRSHYDSRR